MATESMVKQMTGIIAIADLRTVGWWQVVILGIGSEKHGSEPGGNVNNTQRIRLAGR